MDAADAIANKTLSEKRLSQTIQPASVASQATVDASISQPHEPMSAIQKFWRSKTAVVLVSAFALFVDMTLNGMYFPTIPKIIKDQMQLPDRYVGLLISMHSIGLIVSTPILGVISDRFRNRKLPLIFGIICHIISMILNTLSKTYVEFIIARILEGVSGGITWSIGFCSLADVFPQDQLGAVIGNVLIANTVGLVAGTSIGGFLYDNLGERVPFMFGAILAILDLCSRLFVRPSILSYNYDQVTDSKSEEEDTPKSTRSALGRFFSNPQAIVSLVGVILCASVYSSIEPTLPLHLEREFGASSTQVGVIWWFISIPTMIGCTTAGHASDRFGRKNVTALGMLLFGLFAPLVAFAGNIYLIACALALFGFTSGASLTPSMPEMADFMHAAGGDAFGTVYATYNIAYATGTFIGPNAGSLLWESYGFNIQLLSLGCILVVLSPVMFGFYLLQRRSEAAAKAQQALVA